MLNQCQKMIKPILIFALLLMASIPMVAADGVVNVNTAGVEELTLLPKVGPTVAGRIIEFREENGAFKATEELMLVKGIGEKTFDHLEPYVSLKGETTLQDKVKIPRSSKT